MTAQKKKREWNQQLAEMFCFIAFIALICNFFYALYSKVSISLGVVLFFIITLIWYISAQKRAKQAKPIDLIDKLNSRGEGILKKNLHADEELIAKLKGSFGEAFVVTNHNVYVVKWGFMTGQFFWRTM